MEQFRALCATAPRDSRSRCGSGACEKTLLARSAGDLDDRRPPPPKVAKLMPRREVHDRTAPSLLPHDAKLIRTMVGETARDLNRVSFASWGEGWASSVLEGRDGHLGRRGPRCCYHPSQLCILVGGVGAWGEGWASWAQRVIARSCEERFFFARTGVRSPMHVAHYVPDLV